MRNVRLGFHGAVFLLIAFLAISGGALIWTTLEISYPPSIEGEAVENQWQEKMSESWEITKRTALRAESVVVSTAKTVWGKVSETVGPYMKKENVSSPDRTSTSAPVVEEKEPPVESDTEEEGEVTEKERVVVPGEKEYSDTLRYRTGMDVPHNKLRTSDPIADGISEDSNEPREIPTSALRADLDGDGDEDAITIGHEGTIVWYQNNGEAESTWLKRVIDPTIDAAILIEIADIDSDGDNDIVSASASRDSISWYDNSGGRTSPFWTRRIIATGGRTAKEIQIKDLDNDGDLDVRVIPTRDAIMWYLNDGEKPPRWDALPE